MLLKKTFFVFSCIICMLSNAFSQDYLPKIVPDLTLVPASDADSLDIQGIFKRTSDAMVPAVWTPADLNPQLANYEKLNIKVENGKISGVVITAYETTAFSASNCMNAMVASLKFGGATPDQTMVDRVNNLTWWINVCAGEGKLFNANGYEFQKFCRSAVCASPWLTPINRKRLLFLYEKQWESEMKIFWNGKSTEVINSDFIYTQAEQLAALAKCYETRDEQYRHAIATKRFLERFTTFTNGTADGLKPDGTGFHHQNNSEMYMYAYASYAWGLSYIDKSRFQIDKDSYLRMRNAILHKMILSNDADVIPLSMTNRGGKWEGTSIKKEPLRRFAVVGGQILGLSTADPVIAGIYNRRYGVSSTFKYSTKAPFETGFYQMNHTNGGVFRKTPNVLIVAKGFNNQFWGSEIYAGENRYGRYQGYGALSIVMPGDATLSGFNTKSWDWRYNPGTTTKVLPYAKLLAPTNRLDEYNAKAFAGSLMFQKKDLHMLNDVTGTYGLFAMDFQEKPGMGFGGYVTTDTHDASFTFKKSTFFFNDVIICLGSDIKTTDASSHVVTTLYQNNASAKDVTVNNTPFTTVGTPVTYNTTADNWVIDNFNNGYYVVAGSGDLTLSRANQQAPSHGTNNPNALMAPVEAAIGYLDHGVKPTGNGYEYLLMPRTTSAEMDLLKTKMATEATKPYEIIQKNAAAHIVKHKATGIVGMSIFAGKPTVPSNLAVANVTNPCLIMYTLDAKAENLKLSLANPDMGLSKDHAGNEPYKTKTIRVTLNGAWDLSTVDDRVTLVSNDGATSVYDFETHQGLPLEMSFVKTTLPVTLTEFTGNAEGSSVRLNWITKSEYNSDYFKVTRSSDGKTFTAIPGQVKAAGSSNQELRYNLMDFSPLSGTNYYKLHLFNTDGSDEVQDKIVAVEMAGKTLEILNAKLEGDMLITQIYSPTATDAKFDILNINGQVCGQLKYNLVEGDNRVSIPARTAPGLLILRLTSNEKTLTKKVIKSY